MLNKLTVLLNVNNNCKNYALLTVCYLYIIGYQYIANKVKSIVLLVV